ncbi:PTS glucitol/sorbitol transporter subunit IIA [Heliobacterium chlorum]|uniref:PTS glucitol/sorbitol transporter subunit IIA n=1 Tax=Heliobacterium chlorum TaxID=2698 RepID=A0ABR7T4C6_HELCL|nr:PTS glucitol/sorbitol transporter subunit IIA [Heliobacterium chlorum]MBC9785205.1 PTS glucitol/sorbitol transporter subunit IIA [Heliobacterium chlorum]
MKKYEVVVNEIGEAMAQLLIQDMLVLFDENAPTDLSSFSVNHSKGNLTEQVAVGDMLYLGDRSYKVTAVGHRVNHILNQMGHATIKFDGADVTRLPGYIHVKGKDPVHISLGEKIVIAS